MIDYSEIWRSASDSLMLEEGRYEILGGLCFESLSLPGDIVECGVYRGGSAYLLAKMIEGTDRTLHLSDTFMGAPGGHMLFDDYGYPQFDARDAIDQIAVLTGEKVITTAGPQAYIKKSGT